jgi:energy-converting hydrogenase Eha subunit F
MNNITEEELVTFHKVLDTLENDSKDNITPFIFSFILPILLILSIFMMYQYEKNKTSNSQDK